jgi:3',5'-cyclic AMP phosphodiesterase CpdA
VAPISSSRAALIAGALFALDPAPTPGPAPPAVSVRPIRPPRTPLPAETASAGITRYSFIVYGDTRGRRDGKEAQYEHGLVMDTLLATVHKLESTPLPVRFVLMTGDAVVSGRDARQWNVSFVDLVNRVTQGAGLPYFLAPGNHDVGGVPDVGAGGEVLDRSAALRNYLAAVSALVPGSDSLRRLADYPTYAFGFGNGFFLALDSNVAGDERQLAWVRGQLEGLDRRRYHHVVVFFHHPVFSSGPHGAHTEPATAGLRRRYMPLFRRHQVTLILTGHEHLYEHWVERWEEGGRHHRLDEIVTGGGGAPLYAFAGRPDLRDYLAAGRAEKVTVQQLVRPGPEPGDTPHHFVVVHVDGDRLSLEVVGVDWGAGFAPYRSRGTSLVDDPAAASEPR